MKRLIWSLLIASALVLTSVPGASAHGSHYRAYERHYVVRHGHNYPYWLRRNSDFHRWYWHSYYRHDFYLSWDQLFDIYRYERRYHRPYRYYDRRGYDRYRDQPHRH
jgi:hypothetical protein